MSDSVDWHRLLWDLIQRGWTLSGIAARVNLPLTTVRGYLDGAHPAHWKGEMLVALWCEVTDRPPKEIQRSEELTQPKSHAVRSAVAHSEAVESALSQLEFAWFGGEARPPPRTEVGPTSVRVRFRIGLANLANPSGQPVCAFVVHDDAAASRVQKAPEFVCWAGEWQCLTVGEPIPLTHAS